MLKLFYYNQQKVQIDFQVFRHKNPTYFVGFLLCSETGILHDAAHRAACGVNPGSQASVTIIRSLALNEIGTRDALSLIIFCLLSVSILA